jgi:hypothetical protein
MAFWLNIPFFGNFREHVAKLLFKLFKQLIFAILILSMAFWLKRYIAREKKRAISKLSFPFFGYMKAKILSILLFHLANPT